MQVYLPLLNEVFVPRQHNYELRGNNFLERRRVKSVRYGIESISSLAPKIWEKNMEKYGSLRRHVNQLTGRISF